MSFQARTPRMFKMILMGFLLLSLASCVAQQADLVKLGKEFEAKVARLDKEKKNLGQTLAEANRAIQESQAVLAQQKSEVSELIRARAQIKSELRSLREENIAQLSGELETGSHRLQRLEDLLDDLTQEVKILTVDANMSDQARVKEIAILRENVKKDFVQQNKTMKENFAALRVSLVDFEKAMDALVLKRVGAEQTRAVTAEANIEAQQADLRVKLDSEAKLLSDLNIKMGTELTFLGQRDEGAHQNLENLAQSVVQLKTGLAKIGEQLGSKIDEHAQRLEKSEELRSDTEALRRYLDEDIRPSLQSLAQVVEVERVRGLESLKNLEGLIESIGNVTQVDLKQAKAQMAAQSEYVLDLNQSVVSAREVLDSMAGMLGKRSDDQLQRIGQLSAKLEQMQQAQSSTLLQQEGNIRILSKHLKEVTASVESVVKSFDQVKTTLTLRLDQQNALLEEQDQRLMETASRLISPEKVNQELAANVQYMNGLKESLRQLQNVVREISSRIGGKVDKHAKKVTQELTANVEYMNQLRESLRSTMELVKEHESHLARLKQQMQQSSSSGGKLGEKVDKHESQLTHLKRQMQKSSAALNTLFKKLKPLLQAPGLQ